MRKTTAAVFIALLMALWVGQGTNVHALNDITSPYVFSDSAIIYASEHNANWDTVEARVAQLNDSIEYAFMRFTDLSSHDSTLKYVKIDTIRSNTNIDSITGGTAWSTTTITGLATLRGNPDFDSVYGLNVMRGNPNIDSISGSPYISSNVTVSGTVDATLLTTDTAVSTFLTVSPIGDVTISSNAITTNASYVTLLTEGAVALDTITTISAGTRAGQLLILKTSNASRDVFIGESSTLFMPSTGFLLDNVDDTVVLIWNGARWICLSTSDNTAD